MLIVLSMASLLFQRLADVEAAVNAEHQSSDEWLKLHSLDHMKLDLKDLVDRGKVGRLEEQ